MELVKKTAKQLLEDYNSCYNGTTIFGGETVEKTIIEILDLSIPFEDKLWNLYCGAFCGDVFFAKICLKIGEICDFDFLPYAGLKEKALEEQDPIKKKKIYNMIASLAYKYHPKEEWVVTVKEEIMSALNEGTLYT